MAGSPLREFDDGAGFRATRRDWPVDLPGCFLPRPVGDRVVPVDLHGS
ncbi:hypothetical protein [Micromonospora aurantiaca (nom. illeg.)]